MPNKNNIAVFGSALNPLGLNDKPLLGAATSFIYMEEIWKDITGFEDYQISNLFRVRSFKQKKEIILKHHFDRNYWGVTLYKNGKRYYRKIHKLYCIEFLPNPENKKYINHKDGIKTHNFHDNFEWVTSSENQIHSYKTGLSQRHIGHKRGVIRIDGATETPFQTVLSAIHSVYPKALNGSPIIKAIKTNAIYRGYKWKYL